MGADGRNRTVSLSLLSSARVTSVENWLKFPASDDGF